jgi:hypothetical protein
MSRKRKSLTDQGDFDKIFDTNRSKLCFLSVSMGMPNYNGKFDILLKKMLSDVVVRLIKYDREQ